MKLGHFKRVKHITAARAEARICEWLEMCGILVANTLLKTELLILAKEHASAKQYVVGEYLREHVHKVIHLPLYHCHFSAIDPIWAQAKQYYDKHIGEEGNAEAHVLAM